MLPNRPNRVARAKAAKISVLKLPAATPGYAHVGAELSQLASLHDN
jgi:hypothetical protein